MAKNLVFREAGFINQSVTCSHPAVPASGDPVRYGSLVGVAQTAEDAAGLTTVAFDGVWLLSVKGITTADAAAAVAVGDRLYYNDADTPPISKKPAGFFVGNATEAVVSGTTSYAGTVTAGATATIPVRLSGAGTGTLG